MTDWQGPLDDLRHHWGSAYLIHFFEPDRWVAQRRDSHTTISADTDGGLLDLIRADYAERPVSRDVTRRTPPPSCRLLPGDDGA